MKVKAAAALVLCVLVTGCGGDVLPDETEYHIYSNGELLDSGVTAVPEVKNNYADFYIPFGMTLDYYSAYSLSEQEKEIYDKTKEDLGRLRGKVVLPVNADIYYKILETLRLEQLSYSHVKSWSTEYSGQFNVLFEYRLTADEISGMNIASEKAAKEIMSRVTPDMDDYEKLKFFHDYLVLNCETSTEDEYADTVYGALVRKKALCEGYTKAFAYLCNLAEIDNVIVTGETTVAHMWNMVKLGGNWYHVDVTWDNPDDALHRQFPDVVLYQYFMVTDSVIKNNHKIWTTVGDPPRAYGTAENYFVREGADVTSYEGLLTAAENSITEAVKNRKSSAMVKFSTTDIYLSSLADLQNEELFTPIVEKIKAEYGENIRLRWTDFYGQYRILTFIIDYA